MMGFVKAALALAFCRAAIADGTSSPTSNGIVSSEQASAIVKAHMTFYQQPSGLWNNSWTPWWESAVSARALLDYMNQTGTRDYLDAVNNTLNVQRAPVPWWPAGGGDFRADSTDDTAWWGLALTAMYTATGQSSYLDLAKGTEAYMWKYWNTTTCGGGLIWDIPSGRYHNAISNGLYLELTATLHNLIPGDKYYLNQSLTEWRWFERSGMINDQHLVNDGLSDDRSCRNNHAPTWSYNQGVLIGGLVQLHLATGQSSYLNTSVAIANAVLSDTALSRDGILTEPCSGTSPLSDDCELNAAVFKGVFVRHLAHLNRLVEGMPYSNYIRQNAASMLSNACDDDNFCGLRWAGPRSDGLRSVGRQVSAVNLMVAALQA